MNRPFERHNAWLAKPVQERGTPFRWAAKQREQRPAYQRESKS